MSSYPVAVLSAELTKLRAQRESARDNLARAEQDVVFYVGRVNSLKQNIAHFTQQIGEFERSLEALEKVRRAYA